MTRERDRARAKRRYAKRQVSAAARAASRRRNQAIIGTVVTVLVVAGGVLALTRMVGSSVPVSAASTPSAATSAELTCTPWMMLVRTPRNPRTSRAPI